MEKITQASRFLLQLLGAMATSSVFLLLLGRAQELACVICAPDSLNTIGQYYLILASFPIRTPYNEVI